VGSTRQAFVGGLRDVPRALLSALVVAGAGLIDLGAGRLAEGADGPSPSAVRSSADGEARLDDPAAR
jgi:hypothetical protein